MVRPAGACLRYRVPKARVGAAALHEDFGVRQRVMFEVEAVEVRHVVHAAPGDLTEPELVVAVAAVEHVQIVEVSPRTEGVVT